MNAPASTGWVQDLELTPPSLKDNTADCDRLLAGLGARLGGNVEIDFGLVPAVAARLREWDYRVRCALVRDRRGWLLTDLIAPAGQGRAAGLAVDLGTTRIALQLTDLVDGRSLGAANLDNPQMAIGPDILARVHHADRPDGLRQLQSMAIAAIQSRAQALCAAAGLHSTDVHLIAIAGNTAMGHLALGLDPRWLIREPYIPVTNSPGMLPAGALGFEFAPRARVFVFPNVGSYFGGDLIAGILSCGLDERVEPALLVDVGTNAEVVLGNRDWLVACAGAAGPALEAGVAEIGMLASDGVIDRVTLDPAGGRLRFATIGGQAPKGICGSGLIDLAAALFRTGRIDRRGQLVPAACGWRYREVDGVGQLVLVPAADSADGRELLLDQRGLTSLTKAKAAMFTILETLVASVGLELSAIERFFVAGAFGSVIDPDSAITIGMLPDLPRERFCVLGNSSLAGAVELLRSAERLERIRVIRDRITYLELNVNQDFMIRFSGAQFYPHTDPTRFPSVPIP